MLYSKEKIYYVYILLDPRKPGIYDYGNNRILNFEPFYVGKGKGSRLYCHEKTALKKLRNKRSLKENHKLNKIKNIINAGLRVISKKVKTNLTEKQAFLLETKVIVFIGRSDLGKGPLTNHSDGGEGPSNPSEKRRKRLSRAAKQQAKNRTPEERKKTSLALKRTRLARTPEENERIREKSSNSLKKSWGKKTEKQVKNRSRKIQKTWKNKSKEELIKFSKIMSNRKKKVWKNYSEDERNIVSKNMSRSASLRAPMSKETRNKKSQSLKIWHSSLSDKQRREQGRKISEGRKKTSPEKRALSRENYSRASLLKEATMSSAKRKERSKNMSISARARNKK
jgi:hypothetical protein